MYKFVHSDRKWQDCEWWRREAGSSMIGLTFGSQQLNPKKLTLSHRVRSTCPFKILLHWTTISKTIDFFSLLLTLTHLHQAQKAQRGQLQTLKKWPVWPQWPEDGEISPGRELIEGPLNFSPPLILRRTPFLSTEIHCTGHVPTHSV